MANHCHIHPYHGNQHPFLFLFGIAIVVLGGCSAYTIRHHRSENNQLSDSDPEPVGVVDRFYFPTDEGLKEFQQILLRELGLTKVPDLSKVNRQRILIRIVESSRQCCPI